MRKLYFTIVINLVSESFVVDVVLLSVTFCLV